jgi:hypothetical protein
MSKVGDDVETGVWYALREQVGVAPMQREKLKQTAFARARVPMRGTGAEAPVVVSKRL